MEKKASKLSSSIESFIGQSYSQIGQDVIFLLTKIVSKFPRTNI